MASTTTRRDYNLSEFTSSSDPNVGIFTQELQDDTNVVEKPTNVYRSGTTITVEWVGVTVSQGTVDAVDADVAAHVGGGYASPPITEILEAETSDDSGDEQTRLELDSGLLPAGNYLLGWYSEVKLNAVVTNTAVAVRLYVNKNGNGEVERGLCTWPYPQYHDFAGSFPFVAADGDRYELRLAWERLGASSNPAFIQRARLFIQRDN
jgi:hypothetical protein